MACIFHQLFIQSLAFYFTAHALTVRVPKKILGKIRFAWVMVRDRVST